MARYGRGGRPYGLVHAGTSVVAAAALALAGCAPGQGPVRANRQAGVRVPASASPSPTPHDPPAAFDLFHKVPLPPDVDVPGKMLASRTASSTESLLLDRGLLYLADRDFVRVLDLSSGRYVGLIEAGAAATSGPAPQLSGGPGTSTAGRRAGTAPVRVVLDGKEAIVCAFSRTVPGNGTVKDKQVVDVVAVDPATAKEMWRSEVTLPEQVALFGPQVEVALAGANDGVVVLGVRVMNSAGMTVGFDVRARRQAWSVVDGTVAGTVTGPTVLALRDEQSPRYGETLVGLDVSTGRKLWEGARPLFGARLVPLGPKRALLKGADYASGDHVGALLDASTGKAPVWEGMKWDDVDCTYDDRSVVVCRFSTWNQATVAAHIVTRPVDDWAWEIPGEDGPRRTAPALSVAWHGRLYGAANGRAVLVDLATGKDLPAPEIVPMLVNEYFAVARVGDRELAAFPTAERG